MLSFVFPEESERTACPFKFPCFAKIFVYRQSFLRNLVFSWLSNRSFYGVTAYLPELIRSLKPGDKLLNNLNNVDSLFRIFITSDVIFFSFSIPGIYITLSVIIS